MKRRVVARSGWRRLALVILALYGLVFQQVLVAAAASATFDAGPGQGSICRGQSDSTAPIRGEKPARPDPGCLCPAVCPHHAASGAALVHFAKVAFVECRSAFAAFLPAVPFRRATPVRSTGLARAPPRMV